MGQRTAKGSLSTLSIGVEGAYGTAANPASMREYAYVSESLALTTNAIVSTQISPNRTVTGARGGNRMSGGSITTDFGINRFAVMLNHLLGGVAVKTTLAPTALAATTYVRGDYVTSNGNLYLCITGGAEVGNPSLNHTDGEAELSGGTAWEYVGPSNTPIYKYVLTAARDLPAGGLTVEKALLGGDVAMYNKFRGGRINQLSLTIPQDNLIQAAWDLLFISADPYTTASYAQNPTYVTDSPIMGYEALLTIAGSENYDLKSGSFTITNNMDGNDFRLGSRDRKTVNEQRREIKGQFDAYFTDPEMFARFQREDVFDVVASFFRAGNFLSLEMPECKFFGDPLPKIGGAGTISSQFDITSYQENAAYDAQLVIKSTTNNLFA